MLDLQDVPLRGDLGAAADTTRELLPDYPDPLDLQAVRRYFELHYWRRSGEHDWDDEGVMECSPEESGECAYDFRTAADQFRLIKDATQTVFVSYDKGARLIDQLPREGPSR